MLSISLQRPFLWHKVQHTHTLTWKRTHLHTQTRPFLTAQRSALCFLSSYLISLPPACERRRKGWTGGHKHKLPNCEPVSSASEAPESGSLCTLPDPPPPLSHTVPPQKAIMNPLYANVFKSFPPFHASKPKTLNHPQISCGNTFLSDPKHRHLHLPV